MRGQYSICRGVNSNNAGTRLRRAQTGFLRSYVLFLVLAVVGILLGIGISLLAENALTRRFPTVRVEVSAHWVMNACLIAMIGALLGALYPAFKAAQKDPIDALAYE